MQGFMQFIGALAEGLEKLFKELGADLNPTVHSIRRRFTALFAIRWGALAALSLMAVYFNDVLGVVKDISWVARAINEAAGEYLYRAGDFMNHYQAGYGRSCAIFYTAIVMLGLLYPLYKRSGHLGKLKYFFVGTISFCALASIYLIAVEAATNATGWYENFYMDTLMPPAAIGLFVYMVTLLWKATKPGTAPATPKQAAGDHQRISLFIVGLRKMKKALSTLWSSVWSHPRVLSLGVVAICLIVLGISQHDTPPDREGLRQQVLRIKEDIKLLRNPGHRQADMAKNLEFLVYRGSYIVGYDIVADAAELEDLKKAVSVASAAGQLRIVNDPSLALVPNRAWRPTAEAIREAKLFGNSTADIVKATGIDAGQLAKAMRELANRWHLSTSELARLNLAKDFLRFTEEIEEIAKSQSGQPGAVWLSSK